MFVGRKAELALLNQQYERADAAFVPIHGRRRIGKSELILHFLRDRPSLYHVGKTAPAQLQLSEFLQQAARVLDEPLLAHMPPNDWRAALVAMTDRVPSGKKLVLALDEFQWLVASSPELPSVLQELWDRRWQRSGNVMLILCGSFMGFMERAVLGSKSPLFGRRTASILLRPFSHHEATAFHPRAARTEQAMTYFVCGGVPLYLRLFESSRPVLANVESVLLDEFGPLHREPDFLLREELRDVGSYYAVLLAIAEGRRTMQEIAARSGVQARSLPYYLQQLIDLGYVSRIHPVTGARPNARQVRFVVADPLLRFWFRFVFPNTSYLQQMGPARLLRERIKPELPSYWGSSFERLCREAMPTIYAGERVNAAFEVGEFWSKDTQIDVVSARDDGWVDLGECKWSDVRSPGAVEEELRRKASKFPNPRGATLALRCFARVRPPSAARERDPRVRWHDLEQLYED
jgi:uncharacterized protein